MFLVIVSCILDGEGAGNLKAHRSLGLSTTGVSTQFSKGHGADLSLSFCARDILNRVKVTMPMKID